MIFFYLFESLIIIIIMSLQAAQVLLYCTNKRFREFLQLGNNGELMDGKSKLIVISGQATGARVQ